LSWLLGRETLAQGARFLGVGAFITVLYLSVTGAMRLLGAPWWLAVGVGYAVATSTHFMLHRKVVFRRAEGFTLSVGQQLPRFVGVVLCQYAVTTLAVTYLPDALGIPDVVVFLAVAATVTVASFVLLRTRLFH
jgi:putative flippase GtrA